MGVRRLRTHNFLRSAKASNERMPRKLLARRTEAFIACARSLVPRDVTRGRSSWQVLLFFSRGDGGCARSFCWLESGAEQTPALLAYARPPGLCHTLGPVCVCVETFHTQQSREQAAPAGGSSDSSSSSSPAAPPPPPAAAAGGGGGAGGGSAGAIGPCCEANERREVITSCPHPTHRSWMGWYPPNRKSWMRLCTRSLPLISLSRFRLTPASSPRATRRESLTPGALTSGRLWRSEKTV